jgi:pilus assembly protein CpaB
MTRRILGVMLAIVLAVVGTAAVLAYVNAVRNEVAAGQEAVRVLIAKDRIPAGTTGASLVERELVEEVVVPALSVPLDAMSTVPQELEALVVTADLRPRQLVLRGMFGPPTTFSGGLTVPENMLAVSVEIEVDQQVAGYVRPGSQIAIFNTYADFDPDLPEGEDNRRTRLLLPRVEVLAVGVFGDGGVTTSARNGEADPDDQPERAGLVLTVAVDQVDAERLIHATRTGQLYLALLSDTSEVSPGPGVSSRTMFP